MFGCPEPRADPLSLCPRPLRYEARSPAFHRQGNGGSDRRDDSLRLTGLVSGQARALHKQSRACWEEGSPGSRVQLPPACAVSQQHPSGFSHSSTVHEARTGERGRRPGPAGPWLCDLERDAQPSQASVSPSGDNNPIGLIKWLCESRRQLLCHRTEPFLWARHG